MADCTCNNFPASLGIITIQGGARVGLGGAGPDWADLVIDSGTNGGAMDTQGRLMFAKGGSPRWQIYDIGTRLGFFDYLGNGEHMTLTGGKVGIGTTTPQARLHLGSGAIQIGTRVVADDGGCYYAD